ncbi:hypothetical protein KM043_016195 [Ampulex compressa]|nr:hypothetical protein KM043_016195 [Ampulex compressa]
MSRCTSAFHTGSGVALFSRSGWCVALHGGGFDVGGEERCRTCSIDPRTQPVLTATEFTGIQSLSSTLDPPSIFHSSEDRDERWGLYDLPCSNLNTPFSLGTFELAHGLTTRGMHRQIGVMQSKDNMFLPPVRGWRLQE